MKALLADGEGVPEDEGLPKELAEAGETIRLANRASVVRYRRAWNAVLPVDTEGALARPWAKFTRGPRSNPSELLRADFGVVPYLFRDAELKDAAAWCEQADRAAPMAVMGVTARGGAGKTRFAIELCKRLERGGWAAGLWRDNDTGADRLPWPRLVVIDYAEEAQAASMSERLDALARHATALAPVRVLLLTRKRVGQAMDIVTEIDESAPATLKRFLGHAQGNLVADQSLTIDQRITLYQEAVRHFCAAWCPAASAGGEEADGMVPDLSDNRYGLALEVLFEALLQVLARCDDDQPGAAIPGGDGASGGRTPAERVLAHEEKYWRITAPAGSRDDVRLLRECAGLATLAAARDQGEAHALLSVSGRLSGPSAAGARTDLIGWLSSMYDGAGILNPLRPDRLGEALVARLLRDQPDGGQAMVSAVLDLSDEQAERCLDVLARLSPYDDAVGRAVAGVICASHAQLTLRAEEQSHGLPGRPGRTALAEAFQRTLTPAMCALVEQAMADAKPGNTAYQRDLLISYVKLADLAVEAGQGERARQLYEQALPVAQRLADAEPGNTSYQRDLSITYERLADLVRSSGQGERARQLYEQVLAVAQRLADAEPGNTSYQLDLSITYERLADLTAEAGQGDRAGQLYEQALAVAPQLADASDSRSFRDRVDELNKVLNGLTNAAGPHFWLVVAPPKLGKTWFLESISTHPRLFRPDPWVVRKVDLRRQPLEIRNDAAALLGLLFGREPSADASQEVRLIAQQVATNGNPHLCVLDSAELLTREAADALRSYLKEIHDHVQRMGNEKLRLTFIAASRRDEGWRGIVPQRLSLLPLTEFTTDVIQQALRDLSDDTSRVGFSATWFLENAIRVHSVTEGLPVLLAGCLQWIRREHWLGLERLEDNERFEELVVPYIEQDLLTSTSLLSGRAKERRPLQTLILAYRALVPYRLFTPSHLRHQLQIDSTFRFAIEASGWTMMDMWEYIRATALLRRPLNQPWIEIHSAIRRLLFRYFYRSEEERVTVHNEARQFMEMWSDNQVGTEQVVGLVECLWHVANVLSLRNPSDMDQKLTESARRLSSALHESTAYTLDELRLFAADRIRDDVELGELVNAGLLIRLVETVLNPEGAGR